MNLVNILCQRKIKVNELNPVFGHKLIINKFAEAVMDNESRGYDNETEYELSQERDPYSERTVYDVEKITFKNRRKSEKNKEN